MIADIKIDLSQKLKQIIETTLEEEFKKEFDLAVKRFEKRKGEIVAGIIVNITKSTDMRIMEDRITFEIIDKKIK